MDTKPSLTYIKKNTEKTIPINNEIIKKLVFTKICKTKKVNNLKLYEISPQVSLIHIKNYTFKESIEFYDFNFLFNNTPLEMLILENCTFTDRDLYLCNIKNIRIIDPKVIEGLSLNITISPTEGINNYSNIEIDLTNSTGAINLKIEDCNELKLNSSEVLKELSLLSLNKVTIINMFDTIITTINNIDNLTLTNSFINKFDPDQKRMSFYYNSNKTKIFNISKILELENSKVILPNNFEIKDYLKIKLKNSIFETTGYIKILNINFIEFNDDIEETILDNSSYITARELIINGQIYKSNILTATDKHKLASTITYITDNKEKTFCFQETYLDDKTYPKTLFEHFVYKGVLQLSKKIQLIHIKNITIKNITEISLYYNQVLILENVSFYNNPINHSSSIYINGGNVKIINPSFNIYGSLIIENSNYAKINFTDTPTNFKVVVKVDKVKNFVINYNEAILDLHIDAQNAYLKDFPNLDKFFLNSKNLILKNSSLETLDYNSTNEEKKGKSKIKRIN